MHDPEKVSGIQVTGEAPPLFRANVQHLQKPEFLALLSALVEDLSDEATYVFTSMPQLILKTFLQKQLSFDREGRAINH
jgi:hypothetical protein